MASPELTGLTDERLLELFHSQRREDCFAELTRRYLDSAYRVAFARCGRREWAEEAVQEAFYRLSRKETAFPSGASVPFKIRLFANVSISARNLLRAERRKKQRTRSQPAPQAAQAIPSSRASEGEAREALARALATIDEEQRMAIVLHYMEGLSQRQVGALVGVAQSVVARRIAAGLATLRARLVQAGVSVGSLALPMLLRLEGLWAAPKALKNSLARPSEPAIRNEHSQAAEAPQPPGLRATRSAPLLVPLLAAAVALAVLALTADQTSSTQVRTAATPVQAAQKNAAPANPTAPSSIHRTWDLRLAPPGDLTVLEGAWRWVEGQGMETPPAHDLYVLPPLEDVVFPLRVEIELGLPRKRGETMYLSVLQTDGLSLPPHRIWLPSEFSPTGSNRVMAVYLTEKYSIHAHGRNIGLLEHLATPVRPRLCLNFTNAVVQRIALDSVSAKEVPLSEEDLERLKQSRGPGVFHERYTFKK